MSAVLKSGSAAIEGRVRALAAFRPPAPPVDPVRVKLAEDVEALTAALADRDAEVARLTEAFADAFAQGEDAGREAGRAEAEDGSAETLAVLQESAAAALARLDGALAGTDALAVLVARTCLERMLLDSEARIATVTDLIRGRLGELKSATVLRIEVSGEDFAAPQALTGLAALLGHPACEIVAVPALAAGDCAIRLQLGALEIGLGQQWGSLRDALDAMAAEGAQ